MEIKVCKCCERKLPKNTDYYFKKYNEKDGFTAKCKECLGKRFTNKLTHIPKEGYKFCKKCDRELEVNIRFYPPDKSCIDGFRNICRECGNGNFMSEEYKPRDLWSKEDEELFIEVYPNYTNEELIQQFFPSETPKSLINKAYRMSNINKTEETLRRSCKQQALKMSGENHPFFGKPKSKEIKEKISLSKKGKYVGESNWLFGRKQTREHRDKLGVARKKLGRWKGDNNPRHSNPLIGEDNPNWQGGVTSENEKIRKSEEYKKWHSSVLKRDNYTCQCCGKNKNLHVHHIENFSNNIDLRFNLDNGFTMCKECHDPTVKGSFHNTYGTFNNTEGQLIEYINRFKEKELKEIS